MQRPWPLIGLPNTSSRKEWNWIRGLEQDHEFFFIENDPVEIKDQTLESMVEKDKCTKLSEDISLSRSSISKSMRLC